MRANRLNIDLNLLSSNNLMKIMQIIDEEAERHADKGTKMILITHLHHVKAVLMNRQKRG